MNFANKVPGLRDHLCPETPRARRQRSRSHGHSKSVAFDVSPKKPLDRRRDHGYESDDSDSTIDAEQESLHYHNSHRHHPPSDHYHSQSHSKRHDNPTHQRPKPPNEKGQEEDSDSTIDLPDRFDSRGRLLAEKEDEPTDTLEQILHGINEVFV